MTNKFTQKERDGARIWELEIDVKIPCTEEEKKIYGVDFKRDLEARNPSIVEEKFNDSGYYYVVNTNCYKLVFRNGFFKSLEKAKEFLIEQYRNNHDK